MADVRLIESYIEVLGIIPAEVRFIESYVEVLTGPIVSTLTPDATASASTTTGGTSAASALDGDLGTEWKSSGAVNGEYIKQTFATGQTAGSYLIAAPNNTAQAPKTWKLQGSNDGSSWSDLHSQTNASAWNAREVREYALSQGYTFSQWRIIFTSAQSDPSTVGLSEFQLFPGVSSGGGGDGGTVLNRGSLSRTRSRSRR